VLLLDTTRSNF